MDRRLRLRGVHHALPRADMSMPDHVPDDDDTYWWDVDNQYEDYGDGDYGDDNEVDDD